MSFNNTFATAPVERRNCGKN